MHNAEREGEREHNGRPGPGVELRARLVREKKEEGEGYGYERERGSYLHARLDCAECRGVEIRPSELCFPFCRKAVEVLFFQRPRAGWGWK